MTASDMPFRYYLRVRYQECDSQHVVFNARYGDYVDIAITEFMKAAMPGRKIFDGSFEIQLVRQLIEWKAPARFDDVLEISVAVSRLGNSSFDVGLDFRKADAGAVIVRCETVYVHVDRKTWRPAPIPADVRELFTAGVRGKVVDHAGQFPIR